STSTNSNTVASVPLAFQIPNINPANTNVCQGFVPDWDKQTYLQAVKGSSFQVSKTGTIEMKAGKMLAAAGDKRLRIETGVSAVLLDPHAVAVITAANNGEAAAQVTVLETPNQSGVVVRTPGGQFIAMKAADDLKVGNNGQALQGNAGSNFFVMQAKADISRMISEDGLLQCRYTTMPTEWKANPNNLGLPPSSKPAKSQTGIAGKPFRPIGHEVLANGSSSEAIASAAAIGTGGSTMMEAIDGKDAANIAIKKAPCVSCGFTGHKEHLAMVPAPAAKAAPSVPAIASNAPAAIKQVNAGEQFISEGNTLIAPDKDTVVRTKHATIQVKKGAVVAVVVEANSTRVLDLHDNHAGEVRVSFGKRHVELRPGSEIDLVEGTVLDGQKLIARADNLAHRSMEFLSYDDNKVAVLSEFSMVDAFMKHPVLLQLRLSDDAQDQKILNQLAKTTAALFVAQKAARGPYYSTPGALGVASKPSSTTK
ncbi:MAG: hypothetical protein K2X27_07345, partial [Candidatus Obscuribacterales bacterium]|nr:hypothetical protein [Candidatus Obscuribacterales bacterium]